MSSCNQMDLFSIRQKPNNLTPAERDELVKSVIPMCAKFASDKMSRIAEYSHGRVTLDDLTSECFLAAVTAAEKFDPTRGNQFSTACYSFLNRHISSYLHDILTRDAGRVPAEFDDLRDNGQREESDGTPDTLQPDESEAILLANLTPEAREIVRLLVIEELTPEQVAVQVGRVVKDVRLIARNSALHLADVKSRMIAPTMFDAAAVESDQIGCATTGKKYKWERPLNDDQRAFVAGLERHIRAVAKRCTPSRFRRNPQALDRSYDTALRSVIRASHTHNPRASTAYKYAIRIAEKSVYSRWEHSSKMFAKSLGVARDDDGVPLSESCVSDSPAVLDVLATKEEAEAAIIAVEAFRPLWATFVRMRFGLSGPARTMAEIASETGEPESTIQRHIEKALRFMRSYLEGLR